MSSLLLKTRTALSLGLRNIARVADYRLRLRAGVHPVQRLGNGTPAIAPFFNAPLVRTELQAPEAWRHSARYFGWFDQALDGLPQWGRSPFTGTQVEGESAPWWTLPDFDPAVGDIKAIWEASRFDWVVADAQRAATGDSGALTRLDAWISDWSARNPAYFGHNWKCGQEASLRVIHLAVAALVLNEEAEPTAGLLHLVRNHLRRIAPTMAYAVGQDNNHGTSEAAALFIGGSWLARAGEAAGTKWERTGRRWLEERASRLVERDGSFSQYSTNYHRLMLDTYSVVELWRRRMGLERFSEGLHVRMSAATEWLRAITDPTNGDAPNIGSNDGANLLPFTDANYRDHRPSVQLAAALFQHKAAYADAEPVRSHLRWLGVRPPTERLPVPCSTLFDDGGYAVLHRGAATAVLRYPRFHFRPSHADALHLDLWHAGENLLRDGGTFGYNAGAEWLDYFGGAQGHNGVQFDDHEQMPRLGRFLWGGWLKTRARSPLREGADATTAGASYRDASGATHARALELHDSRIVVRDTVSGFARRAVFRWRLRPTDWRATATGADDGAHHLSIASSVAIVRCEIVRAWESRFYARKSEVPMLEVEIASPGEVVTEYRWAS